MKKLFIFAAAALALAACSNDELNVQDEVRKVSQEAPVNFDVYAQRGITRAGGQRGDLTNANIGRNGFGVFAYYTAGEGYSTSATPNFMYNQRVTCEGTATEGTLWKYEPVKYWPNEYGTAAMSDDVDYLSFFAYAPWTDVEPTTGEVRTTTSGDESIEHQQKYNIISVNKNSATGDPIVKYVVDTDPATSVDLLWGVAAEKAVENYSPIDGAQGTHGVNKDVKVNPGLPFLDLVKPNDPAKDRLMFNLKHALAKVKITVDYIVDSNTPEGNNGVGDNEIPDGVKTINSEQTRIFVRSFKIGGWATQGALNLNNTEPGQPLWKDLDGMKDLAFADVTFFDGRKDGKEGTTSGTQKSETPIGLNPNIIENYSTATKGEFGAEKNLGVAAMTPNVVKEATVTDKVAKGTVLMFGGDPDKNDGYFYVIPRNQGEQVDIEITYDVETIDENLASQISDALNTGISIENQIRKEAIFGPGIDFEPGFQYLIKVHIGMTSVKVEATVQPWIINDDVDVDLPDNQNPAEAVKTLSYPQANQEFYFKSYFKQSSKAIDYGKVKATGNFVGGYAEVEVVNSNLGYTGTFYLPTSTKLSEANTLGDKNQLIKKDGEDYKATGIFVYVSEEDIFADDGDYMDVSAALTYTYTDYTYKGRFAVDGTTIKYTPQTADPEDYMKDMARFLGALYRAANVDYINYNGVEYTWNASLGLKGSNWAAGANTLVSVITAQYNAAAAAGTLGSFFPFAINLNGIDYSVTLNQ